MSTTLDLYESLNQSETWALIKGQLSFVSYYRNLGISFLIT